MSTLAEKILRKLDRTVGVGTERVHLYSVVSEDAIANLACPTRLTVARLLPDQMPQLSEVYSSFEMSELDEPQRKQSRCYGAWLADHLVHHSWVQSDGSHRIAEAGRRVDVESGDFWIYDCRTSPSARGLGVYPYVLTFILREYFKNGCQKGVIYTTEDNVASQRGILKAGFQLKETLRALRIGRRHYPL
jgi:RimJ/RimL family protein N-acetyltransferase